MKVNQYKQPSDDYYMSEALSESLKGLGWTSPNPLVGCVIVKDERIIGRGHHHQYGGTHAEVMALDDCTTDCRGATAYVNLEPCTHVAHQGPCCAALVASGISEVVYSIDDTDIRTAAMARPELEKHGIRVRSGIQSKRTESLLDNYLHSKKNQTTFVHLKLALSLDAKLACSNGASQWLSCPESLGYAHFLRQKYDAVMVGIGTVFADNPRLTTRAATMQPYFDLPDGTSISHPVRVILDSGFESLKNPIRPALFDLESDGFSQNRPRAVIIGEAGRVLPDAIIPSHTEIIEIASVSGTLLFQDVFSELLKLQIYSVLVEGGSRIASELFRQAAVHKASLVYTPQIIGSDGMGFTPELMIESLNDSIRLERTEFEQLGSDILVTGYLVKST